MYTFTRQCCLYIYKMTESNNTLFFQFSYLSDTVTLHRHKALSKENLSKKIVREIKDIKLMRKLLDILLKCGQQITDMKCVNIIQLEQTKLYEGHFIVSLLTMLVYWLS